MKTDKVTVNFSFLHILTFIFVVGKIFGQLDWSWWWVFSPTLIPLAFLGVFTLFCLVMAGIARVVK